MVGTVEINIAGSTPDEVRDVILDMCIEGQFETVLIEAVDSSISFAKESIERIPRKGEPHAYLGTVIYDVVSETGEVTEATEDFFEDFFEEQPSLEYAKEHITEGSE